MWINKLTNAVLGLTGGALVGAGLVAPQPACEAPGADGAAEHAVAAGAGGRVCPLPASLTLAGRTFEAWLGYIVPTEEEMGWHSIPWRTRFWDAVLEARRAERPVLLWGPQGHPLGCT